MSEQEKIWEGPKNTNNIQSSHPKVDECETTSAEESLDALKGVEQHLQYAPVAWRESFQKFNPLQQKYLMEHIEFLNDRTNIIVIMKDKKVKVSVAKDLFVADEQLLQDFPSDVREYNGKTFISWPKAREIIPENIQLTWPILIAIARMMPDSDFVLWKMWNSNKHVFDVLGWWYDWCLQIEDDRYPEKWLVHFWGWSGVNTWYLMTPTRHKETLKPYVLSVKDSLDMWALELTETSTLMPMLTLKAPIEELA